MNQQNPDHENELNAHEQRIEADRKNLSPEEVARIEGRRKAIRTGIFGAGAMALGLGLGSEKKAEAQINTGELIDEEQKQNEKEITKMEKERGVSEKDSEVGSLTDFALGVGWEAFQEFLVNQSARQGIGRFGGWLNVQRVSRKATQRTQAELDLITGRANSKNFENPAPSEVTAAVQRMKTRTKQELKNARKHQEIAQDIATIMEWLYFLGYRRDGALNPFKGKLYGRIASGLVNYSQMSDRKGRRETINDKADTDVALIDDQLQASENAATEAVKAAHTRDENAEREAQETKKKNEQQTAANEAETERETNRKKAENEDAFSRRYGTLRGLAGVDENDPSHYDNLGIEAADLTKLIEKYRKLTS